MGHNLNIFMEDDPYNIQIRTSIGMLAALREQGQLHGQQH